MSTDTDGRAAAITALTATLTAQLDEDEHYLRVMTDAGERGAAAATPEDMADVAALAIAVLSDPEARKTVERWMDSPVPPPNDMRRLLRDVQAKRDLAAAILREPHTFIPGDEFYSCSQAVDGSGCSDPDRAGQPCDCGRDARVERLLRILVGVYEEGRLVVEVDARSGRVVGVVEPGGSGGGHLLQRPAPEWVWGSSEEEGERR